LVQSKNSGLLTESVKSYISRLTITDDYSLLVSCELVLECVIEKTEVKQLVYKKIERIVNKETLIATNTSAIPISELQEFLDIPNRFLGIHWAEPSYLTRFMEITCGSKTNIVYAEWVYQLAYRWDKEPTLLRKDIRGFVTNRLMYAVYREGLSLIAEGYASLEDIDKVFRYDAGSWMTFMGIFRRMDFLGLEDFETIFENCFPTLCNDDHVSPLMQQMVEKDARGIQNLSGLYSYSLEEARKWEEAFASFNVDIFKLVAKYPRGKVKSLLDAE
jgi:3-hydroxybutyryl-CoA dehydrogenase